MTPLVKSLHWLLLLLSRIQHKHLVLTFKALLLISSQFPSCIPGSFPHPKIFCSLNRLHSIYLAVTYIGTVFPLIIHIINSLSKFKLRLALLDDFWLVT